MSEWNALTFFETISNFQQNEVLHKCFQERGSLKKNKKRNKNNWFPFDLMFTMKSQELGSHQL